MKSFNPKEISNWCLAAISMFERIGVSTKISDMQRAAVERLQDSNKIMDIAEDLAEGIADLPKNRRESFVSDLKNVSSIGYEMFLERRYRSLRKALYRGKISSKKEYSDILAIASDTTANPQIIESTVQILRDFESKLSGKGDVPN
jgi:hypothetical protein